MFCATNTPFRINTATEAQAGDRLPSGNDRAPVCAPDSGYLVYCLEELATGRHYVGLTGRSLQERIASHISQARRGGRVRPGGLMAALRLMESAGQLFSDCFSCRILALAETVAEARTLERHWVDRLECRTPFGLNGMPGGSSAGGTENAKPLTATGNDGGTRTYATIRDAIAARNVERDAAGQPPLEAGTVYARIASGWAPEEALGIQPRQYFGSVRRAIAIGDTVFTTLQEASEATGLSRSTLSSRLHRAMRTDAAGVPQIGLDRRARGPGRPTPLGLPWPGTNKHLTAAQYATRSGAPKATIMHRWHRVRAVVPVGTVLPAQAVQRFLTSPAGGKRAAANALARLLSHVRTLSAHPSMADASATEVLKIP